MELRSQAVRAGNAPGVKVRYWLHKGLDLALRRKKIVVVDLDSTLFPFIPAFVAAAHEVLGKTLSLEPKDFHGFFEDLTSEELGRCFERCNDPDFIAEHFVPFERAADALHDLDPHVEIRYYTDRPVEAHGVSVKWLRDHGFPRPTRLWCCSGDKKSSLIKLRGRVEAIIDDRPYTTVWSYYEARIPHVLAVRNSTNWNLEDLPFVHLADTWHELEGELVKRLH